MKSSNQKSNFNFDNIPRCPKCTLICEISLISDDNISIKYSCENKHEGKIGLKEYLDNQCRNFSISKALCNDCSISQEDKDGFMYCSNCNKFICYDCIKKHKGHERFSIDKYDALCKKHSNFFSSYCNNCKINLCPYCIDEHKNHKIINLTKLKYSEDTKIKLKNDIDNYKKETDNLKDILKEIISLFHNTLEQIELKSNLVSLLWNTYEYNESKNNLNFYTYQNLDVCVKQFELDKTKLSDFIEDLNTFYQNLKKTIEKYNKQPFEKQNNINDKKFANINKNIQIKNHQTEINEKNNNLQNIQENFDKNEINNNHYNKKKTFEKKNDENNDYLNYHIKNDYNFDDKPFFEEKINHPMSEESNKDKFKETNINQNQKINLNNEIKIQPNRKQSCETLINKQIKNENITNLYNFNCQFKNNGIYEFNKLINFKPKISFLIKNIGNIDWKENEIFLKTNKNSQLKFNDCKLSPLNKEEIQKISLTMPSINKFKDGNYNIILDFCANNQIYGEPIKFKVKIFQDENILVKIIDFTTKFDLDEKEFPNEKVLEALKRNNFDYYKTFQYIFNN